MATKKPKKLTHLDSRGRARMVDVGGKKITARRAVAGGRIRMSAAAFSQLKEGKSAKGDVLAAARIAAIGAAKKTSELIPLCHILPLNSVKVEFELEKNAVYCTAEVSVEAKTGVEMESLVAVNTALLVIYDMLKAVDKGMVVGDIQLLKKTGGKSGNYSSKKAKR